MAVAALARVALGDSHRVRLVVDAAVARALRPWKLAEDKTKAAQEAVDSLPIDMRWSKEWRERASEIAIDAIRRTDGQYADMVALARSALRPLAAEYEHGEKIARALQSFSVPGANSDELTDAKANLRDALRGLPVGASDRQIAQAKDQALASVRMQISLRQEEEAKQAAGRRDEEARKDVLSHHNFLYRLPFGLSEHDRSEAREDVEKAIAAFPAGTSISHLEKARDEVIRRYQTREQLIQEGLREISRYAGRLLENYDFEFGETAWSIERRVKDAVEETLRGEIKGSEGQQFVIDRVHKLMKDLEGCH
jgi:hypothetical protein